MKGLARQELPLGINPIDQHSLYRQLPKQGTIASVVNTARELHFKMKSLR